MIKLTRVLNSYYFEKEDIYLDPTTIVALEKGEINRHQYTLVRTSIGHSYHVTESYKEILNMMDKAQGDEND